MRKVLKLFSLSLLGILLSLLMLELSFAIFFPQETFAKRSRNANRCWQKDEVLPVRPKLNCSYVLATSEFENKMQINAQGFRGPVVAIPKPTDVTRIVITGDSLVFGSGVDEKNMISTKIQDLLKQKGIFGQKKVEVINAGFLGGFSTDGHLLGIKRLIAQSVEPSDSQFYGIQSDDCVFGDRCHRRFVHLFSDLVSVMRAGQQEINKISEEFPNFLVVLIPVDFQIYADAVDKYGGAAVSGGIQYAHQNPMPQPQEKLRKLFGEAAIGMNLGQHLPHKRLFDG